MIEVEAVADGGAQSPVVDTQDDRNPGTLGCLRRVGQLPQDQAGLDIDHIVLGQYRDRAGVFGPGRGEGCAQGGVAGDDQNLQFGGGGQVPVVLVALDDRDRVAGVLEHGGHPDAERAQPDDDDMAMQVTDLLAAGGLGQPSGQQHIGD